MLRSYPRTADAILTRLPEEPPPAEGGPLSLTPAAFAALILLPWACDPQIQAALLAARADGRDALAPALVIPGMEEHPRDALHELAAAVAQLEPGTRLALVTANTGKVKRDRVVTTDLVLTAGNARVDGRMDLGCMVHLERAYPPATAERLSTRHAARPLPVGRARRGRGGRRRLRRATDGAVGAAAGGTGDGARALVSPPRTPPRGCRRTPARRRGPSRPARSSRSRRGRRG